MAAALRVIYVSLLGTAWSLTFDDGESENRRGWTTSSATFQDVATVRKDFVKSRRILAQRTRSRGTRIEFEIQRALRAIKCQFLMH